MELRLTRSGFLGFFAASGDDRYRVTIAATANSLKLSLNANPQCLCQQQI